MPVTESVPVHDAGLTAVTPTGLTLDDYLALDGPLPAVRAAYGAAPAQFGELHLPAGAGPHPMAAIIHGGCWTRAYGGIVQMRAMVAALLAQGVAVWNIEYRCYDDEGGGYPGMYQDVGAAMDLLRTLAPQHGLDLTRTVLIGHSAGGHLAQWAASRARLPAASPLRVATPLPAKAVISLGGLADLRNEAALILASCERCTAQLAGQADAARPDVFADTSPAEMLPCGVPTLLIHGEYDTISPPRVGHDYARRARAAGDVADVIVLPGASHYDEVAPASPAWAAVGAAIGAALRPGAPISRAPDA